jgi:hypothetical protein
MRTGLPRHPKMKDSGVPVAHQLVELQRDGKPVFDSTLVITDRRILDRQIRGNNQFSDNESSAAGWPRPHSS